MPRGGNPVSPEKTDLIFSCLRTRTLRGFFRCLKAAARRAAAPFGLTGVGEIVRSGRSRRGTGSDAAALSGGTGAAGPAGEEAESAVLTAEFRRPVEAGAGESARVLSRAVQQDARRYDGGFRLYE